MRLRSAVLLVGAGLFLVLLVALLARRDGARDRERERLQGVVVVADNRAAESRRRYQRVRARYERTPTIPAADSVIAAADSVIADCDAQVAVRDSVIALEATVRRVEPWVAPLYDPIAGQLVVQAGVDLNLTRSVALTAVGELSTTPRLLVGARIRF